MVHGRGVVVRADCVQLVDEDAPHAATRERLIEEPTAVALGVESADGADNEEHVRLFEDEALVR